MKWNKVFTRNFERKCTNEYSFFLQNNQMSPKISKHCCLADMSCAHSPTFRHFTYVTTHSPTLLSLYLRHSSFSNPSVASPTSQLILQPFFRFSYVTGSSLTSPGEPPIIWSQLSISLPKWLQRFWSVLKVYNTRKIFSRSDRSWNWNHSENQMKCCADVLRNVSSMPVDGDTSHLPVLSA